MRKVLKPYVVSFQTEPFHKGRRYHWMICTLELAEAAAEDEVQVLSSGITQGGPVVSATKPFTRRCIRISATES